MKTEEKLKHRKEVVGNFRRAALKFSEEFTILNFGDSSRDDMISCFTLIVDDLPAALTGHCLTPYREQSRFPGKDGDA